MFLRIILLNTATSTAIQRYIHSTVQYMPWSGVCLLVRHVIHFWPTVLLVEPLVHCVVCLSVVCDVLYCGKTVRPSEKLSEGVNRKPGSKNWFFGSAPYFYFRFHRYGHRDGRFCLIFARTARQLVLDGTNWLSSSKPCAYCQTAWSELKPEVVLATIIDPEWCLSLIHIWRCRRIERCRSRWSPYH